MNKFLALRKQLGVTQAEISVHLGVTQSNVSFYEKGQTIPPAVASRFIDFARTRGLNITFDDIYSALRDKPAATHPEVG